MINEVSEVMNDDLYSSTISELQNRYLQCLSTGDLSQIYSSPGHSGIFLPMPARAYISSPQKVIIIGQETKSWRNGSCDAKLYATANSESIRRSMIETLSFNTKKPRKSRFRQFYKRASYELCRDSQDPNNAALWSNQFCVSYKGKSPTRSEQFLRIKSLSYEILRAQFDVLSPDIAIFNVGSSRDKFIKECFEYETIEVVEPRRLWHFKIGDTQCFRTNHPRWGGSTPFLEKALEIAKSYV